MTEVGITDRAAADCIEPLWHDAFTKDVLSTICTLLRVSGLQDAGWHPSEEPKEAFRDCRQLSEDLPEKTKSRIGLLMYCQAANMSAVHSVLANLLSIILDQPHRLNLLGSLGQDCLYSVNQDTTSC